MICFEIAVNGTTLGKAGIGEPGDVHASIIWVLRHGQFDCSGTPGTEDETASLTVTGQIYSRHQYVEWPSRNLKAGDEILIRVVESDVADEPIIRETIKEASILESRRSLYEKLKRHFEGS